MSTNNSFMHLLFCNMSELLSNDLEKYEMHPLEKGYFEELLNLFKDMGENVQSFEDNKKFKSDNIVNLFLIPDIYNTLESNKNIFSKLIDDIGSEKLSLLFKFIYEQLNNFYNGKTIDNNIKSSLINFFKFLAQKYDDQRPFEERVTLGHSDLYLVKIR